MARRGGVAGSAGVMLERCEVDELRREEGAEWAGEPDADTEADMVNERDGRAVGSKE